MASAMVVPMTPDEQQREIARMDAAAGTAETAARLGYQVKYTEMVFRALVLVNGGALIALFTLLGNLGKDNPAKMTVSSHLLWWAFGSFCAGLVFVITAGVCAFLSQVAFYEVTRSGTWNDQAKSVGAEPKYDVFPMFKFGNGAMMAGIGAALASLLSFLLGSGLALASVLPAS